MAAGDLTITEYAADGATVVARLLNGSGTQLGSDIPLTETGTTTGGAGVFSTLIAAADIPAGAVSVVVVVNGTALPEQAIVLDGGSAAGTGYGGRGIGIGI